MAPRRKKTAANATPAAVADAAVDGENPGALQDEAKCPGCTEDDGNDQNKDTWICCDACKNWYHWGTCAGIDVQRSTGEGILTPDQVDKWFCKPCIEADPSRVMTMKPPPRKSGRRKNHTEPRTVDTVMSDGTQPVEEPGPATNPQILPTASPTVSAMPAAAEMNKWISIAESARYAPDNFRRMSGSDIGFEWILRDENAMKEPIVVESPEGLGMKMPSKDLTVRDIANEIGPDTHVEVIDVLTQSSCPGWTLGKWADYFDTPPQDRDKIRNVISLEVTGTSLGQRILPPRLVRELDWVEKHWPHNKKQIGQFPKVQLYCLMGVANAWTDWHIDFAGSSVYYHILYGSKVFYFVKPTQANLAAYEHWSGTDIQNHTWLGDMVDEVVRVELTSGNTMIIPTGWIHAVYTPKDTLVFGGNFLHSLNIKTQLRVREIEIRTKVPKKFRFPFFTKLCWYVGEKYCKDLKAKEDFSLRVLKSLDALAAFLVSEARTIERGSEAAKKEARENVPVDRVKDPGLLARELRWRVRMAAGSDSDAELGDDDGGNGIVTVKREHGSAEAGAGTTFRRRRRNESAGPLFKNWQPPEWNSVENVPKRETHDTLKVEGEGDSWMAKEGLSGDVMRSIRTNGIVKLRKLDHGSLERYSVVRTVEYITPSGASEPSTKMVL